MKNSYQILIIVGAAKKYMEVTESLSELVTKKTFVIADTHFDHKNMLKYEPIRANVALYHKTTIDNYMVQKWNEKVDRDSIVLHLGDFAFRNIQEWSEKLSGKKILIRGNHDNKSDRAYTDAGWIVVNRPIVNFKSFDYELILSKKNNKRLPLACIIKKVAGKKIMFSHLPVADSNIFDRKFSDARAVLWKLFTEHNCQLNIHGHIHNKVASGKECLNASVERINFTPIRLADFLRINKQTKKKIVR